MHIQKNFTKNLSEKTLGLLPYPQGLLKISPWNEFVEQNGYISLSRKLNLKVFSSFSDAQQLWEMFSPNESAFDLWEVRKAFFDGYHFDPYFLSLIRQKGKEKETIGVLPLWFNTDKDKTHTVDFQKYVWFGSNWPEDNVFFVKDKELIPLLLIAAPKPMDLACIKPAEELDFLHYFHGFSTEEDAKYFLDLSKTKTLNDFLSKLKKKKRYNLRRDKKRILRLAPKIYYNEKSHLEDLFSLSIKRFREMFPDEPNEHSAFEDERRKNVFRSLLQNAGRYKTRIITTVINGEIAAVEFGLVYNKTYFALNSGANISRYSGLGVFSNLLVIKDAIKLGCQKIDFLEGDNNWKDSWHLDHFYQYQFKK